MLRRLFNGRYGIDALSIFILCIAVPFFYSKVFWFIGVFIIVYVLFRTFSRNIEKRRNELFVFNDILRKVAYFFLICRGRTMCINRHANIVWYFVHIELVCLHSRNRRLNRWINEFSKQLWSEFFFRHNPRRKKST